MNNQKSAFVITTEPEAVCTQCLKKFKDHCQATSRCPVPGQLGVFRFGSYFTKTAPVQCCERDHNHDGNCDLHPQGRPYTPPVHDATARHQEDIGEFQERVFPNQPAKAKLIHLQREVQEAIDSNLNDLEEWADCLNLLLGAAIKHGIRYRDLLEAAKVKLAVCQSRKWGPPDAQGVYHHLED